MKRIVMHWTAGGHKANGTDKRHYHFIVELGPDGKPRVVAGNQPPEANERIATPGDGSTYAAHTRNANTGAIGVAVAGMRGAKERPFTPGPSPMTAEQVDLMCRFVADLAKQYRIPITPSTVLTHAEVERTLGIPQRNKWDIMWIPGLSSTQDPIAVGNMLRERISDFHRPGGVTKDGTPTMSGGPVAIIIAGLLALAAFLGLR